MKKLKYHLVQTTEVESAGGKTILTTQGSAVELMTTDTNYAANIVIAKKEAYNGEVTVEDVPDVPMPPTVEELAAENKLLHQQVVALTDRGDFQEELIVELANIVYA